MNTLEKMVFGVATLVSLNGCKKFPYCEFEDENVVLYPTDANPSERLHCRVDGVEGDATFDFYWLVNKQVVDLETGIVGLLDTGYTQSGDYVECDVWTPAYGDPSHEFKYGSDSLYIK